MHPYIILLLLLETSVFQVPLINSSGKGSIWIEAKQFKYPSLTPHTNYVTTFHGCVVLGFTHSPVLNWQCFFCLSVMQKSQARIFKCLTFEIPGPDLSEVQSLCKCVWNWESHASTWCLLVSLKKNKIPFLLFFKIPGQVTEMFTWWYIIYVMLYRDGGRIPAWSNLLFTVGLCAVLLGLLAETANSFWEEFLQLGQKTWICL